MRWIVTTSRRIKIDHEALAFGNVASCCLRHRLMGGVSRPEAVTVLGKRRVPPLLENLQQSLLDHPFDRLRLIGSIGQLRQDRPCSLERVSTLFREPKEPRRRKLDWLTAIK